MKVGVMDSGAGGISILNRILRQHPYLSLHYLADSGFAPYGNKSKAALENRLITIGRYFESVQVKAIVVACNTATVAGIDVLRANTYLPVIGVEPAVKPACNGLSNRVVAVLATPFTAQSERLEELVTLWRSDCQVHIIGHPDLANGIDNWPSSRSEVEAMVCDICSQLVAIKANALVLACTHYPLVKFLFSQYLLSTCEIVEPSHGVSAQLLRRLHQGYPNEMQTLLDTNTPIQAELVLESTGEQSELNYLQQWVEDKQKITALQTVDIAI
ncbi:glutamate racemase [Marinomonas epiphytica]